MNLLQVSPYFPPDHSGVGDAAAILQQRLEDIGASNAFPTVPTARLTGNPQVLVCGAFTRQSPARAIAAVRVEPCDWRAVSRAITELNPQTLLLHYSGYGYAATGAPYWLLCAVRAVRRSMPNIRIATIFHELYATGKPWRRAFWLSPMQRYVAAQLATLSDVAWSTSPVGVNWLSKVRGSAMAPVEQQSMWSMIGEPELPAEHRIREATALVFGGGGMLRQLLVSGPAAWVAQLQAMGIKRIVQVGHLAGPFQSSPQMPVEERGSLSPGEVSELMQGAAIGVLAYPMEYLGKSSIAAAYLAHALPFLLVTRDGSFLMPGRERRCAHWTDLSHLSLLAKREYDDSRHSRTFVDKLLTTCEPDRIYGRN